MITKQICQSVTLAALVACGGTPKSTVGPGAPPPPPNITKTQDVTQTPTAQEPKRELSKDAKSDYQAALANFNDNEKGGWNDAACRGSADKFGAVAREHPDLVEAKFMVGLSWERCGKLGEAEAAYQDATKGGGDPTKKALALSNLGTIYYKANKVDAAKSYWDSAIKANGKLVGARINVASLELEQMRRINNPKDANWKKLEEDARFNLSNVLGVDSDNVEAYTVYGLIYMEGWKANKNRLDLAKLLLDEAKKRNEKYAHLQNAYGLYYMHKNSLNQAAQSFAAAVEADPKFVEARVNVGLLNVGFRKYDTAKDILAKAVELEPRNYDALIGLGIAQRGLNDFDGAEASYKAAMKVDPSRGDSYFNLGVLYKAFRANKQDDLKKSIDMYATAKGFFQQFLDKGGDPDDIAEAKEHIKDCDKVTKQLNDFIKAQANMPQQPPTPPPPPSGSGSGSP